MAASDTPKQSLLKKTSMQPFQFEELKRKSSAPASPPAVPVLEDHLCALPLLEYASLDPNKKNVRLIEILPAPEYEPIQVTMSICDLDENPRYVALSYMWDKDSHNKYIDIQGARCAVGEGLWNFLQQYRKKQYLRQCSEKDPIKALPLWIDAIVIDQSNISERNHQVSLMRDIYTGARHVIVWLGLAIDSEELAFMLARRPSLRKVEEFYTALANVLNKPYWGRVWVVQEFVLAQAVEIWCGDFQVEATTIESIWRDGLESTPVASPTKQISTSRGYLLFKYRRDFKHSKQYKGDIMGPRNSRDLRVTFRLRDLLQAFASSESTIPYDRVYGFLGVVSKGREEKITPDYSKSLVELLVDVLRNQCRCDHRGGDKDDYKLLTFLMDALKVSRETLAQHALQICPEVQPHVYVLTATPHMVASVLFVSTISEVGEFVDHDEAFLPATWTSGWPRSKMHPRCLPTQDIKDLREHVLKGRTDIMLSFADPHVSYGNPGPSERVRQSMIEESTDMIISGLVQASAEKRRSSLDSTQASGNGSRVIRDIMVRSMTKDAATLYLTTRNKLTLRNTDQRHTRYTSFIGTNSITGFVCGGGPGSYEIRPGDRICMFSGITDSNNAFVARLSRSGKWLISGFAIILLPELRTPLAPRTKSVSVGISSAASMTNNEQNSLTENTMCFHCHLSDLLELQRCHLLGEVQMNRLLEGNLRQEAGDKKHQCQQQDTKPDILEFGL